MAARQIDNRIHIRPGLESMGRGGWTERAAAEGSRPCRAGYILRTIAGSMCFRSGQPVQAMALASSSRAFVR